MDNILWNFSRKRNYRPTSKEPNKKKKILDEKSHTFKPFRNQTIEFNIQIYFSQFSIIISLDS